MRRRQAFAAQTAAREAAKLTAPQEHTSVSFNGMQLTVGAPAKPEKVYWEAIGDATEWPQTCPNECPKCGRTFRDGRGKKAHIRACKA